MVLLLRGGLLAWAGVLVAAEAAWTQAIVPDGTLGADSSRVVTSPTNLNRSDIAGGAVRGANLFHSFSSFNVDAGKLVYFNNPNPTEITSIIGRVTGNSLSNIQGTLGVAGSANLFLLNPNGVVFGPSASLDIQGSFVASTGARFSFEPGLEFSAVAPGGAPLLTIGINPGLQVARTEPLGPIVSQANLTVGGGLGLAGTTVELTGQVRSGGDVTLLGTRGVTVRDEIGGPTSLNAAGNLLVQGNQSVELSLLNHSDSSLVSGRNMTFRSANAIVGDAHFQSSGNVKFEDLNGSSGRLISPNDPIIRAAGDVTLAAYEGASLHVLAGGSVTIPTVTITGVAPAAGALVEAVPLSRSLPDGTTVIQVNGRTRPTLDVRAGTTAFGLPTQASGGATNADITIDRITITQPNGLVFLTNQYRPNALSGMVKLSAIDTRNPGGSGDVVIDSRGGINLSSSGLIRTNSQLNGAAGDISLIAQGKIELEPRYVIQARADGGQGGTISILADALILNSRTQIDTSTYGTGRGGDLIVDVRDTVILKGSDTRLVSLVDSDATGNSGNIRVKAGTLDITNGAGIFNGVQGRGNSGNIEVDVRDAVTIDGTGGGSNSAIMNSLFPGAIGTTGDIVLRAGSLLLQDGGVIITESGEGATGRAGNMNVVVQGETIIAGPALDKTLDPLGGAGPDLDGKVDVFFLADNTSSMGGVIRSVQKSSSSILDSLTSNDPRFQRTDTAFGVGRYGFERDTPEPPKYAYNLFQPITTDKVAAKTAFDKWTAGNLGPGSGDRVPREPNESNFFGLHQVATSGGTTDGLGPFDNGEGTGAVTGWRDGAARFIVWLGDEPSRANRVDLNEAIAALKDNNIRVIAVNTKGARSGIDAQGQASAIVNATNGSLRNKINVSGIADIILNAIDAALFPDYISVSTSCTNGCQIPSGLRAGAKGNGLDQVSIGGNIRLQSQSVKIDKTGYIQSDISGYGSAGSIEVTSPIINLSNSASIASFGSGLNATAGNIVINSIDRLTAQANSSIVSTIVGLGNSGNVTINANQLNLDLSAIGTSSFGSVQAGKLSISAGDVQLANLSVISTNSAGASLAGDLVLDAKTLELNGKSSIGAVSASAEFYSDITKDFIQQLTLTIDPSIAAYISAGLQSIVDLTNVISAGASQGDSANITIRVDQDTILNGGGIGTKSIGTSNGGNLSLTTGNLILTNEGRINSEAKGTGNAGNIGLTARDRIFSANSEIAATASQADGGNISLDAQDILLRDNSLISTSVFSSFGGGGNISINARSFVATENSDILANAEQGPGGEIFIQSPAFLANLFSSGSATPVGRNPGSFDRFRTNARVDISADSASGTSGTVTYPNIDPSRGLVQLPLGLDDRRQISNPCSQGSSQQTRGLATRDEFVITGRGGIAKTPEDSRSVNALITPWATLSDATPTPSVPTRSAQTTQPQALTEATTIQQSADGKISLIDPHAIALQLKRSCELNPIDAIQPKSQQEISLNAAD